MSLASDLIDLEEISRVFGSDPVWGNHVYKTQLNGEYTELINKRISLRKYVNFIASNYE